MTFLQALYGSQYQEIRQKGGDGNKGRINGNMFLTAFIVLLIFLLTAIFFKTSSLGSTPLINEHNIVSGKLAGKLLALPLFFIVYTILSKTIGTQKHYEKIIEKFNQLPEEVRKKANLKILVPFLSLLLILIVIVIFF
ncbi:MAG TPA: hypothetical protein PKC91_02730 [Ignavibacteria bacterium]|nr:hypothetical protein [Ignavibacteria bacterium]